MEFKTEEGQKRIQKFVRLLNKLKKVDSDD